jgi:hypothetical protein
MVCLAEALQRLLAVFFLSILSICYAADLRGQTVGANEIGGVVTSANGPEAGVWVIAETTYEVCADRRHRRPRALSHS